MVKIHIKENQYITCDDKNWIIGTLRVDKSRDNCEKIEGDHFYHKIEFLIDHLVEKSLLQKEAKSFQEIIKNIEELKKELLEAFNKANICLQS